MIAYREYYNCTKMISLMLPSTLVTISKEAFSNCENLLGPLTIPDNVITIEDKAFYMCMKITSLTFGSKVEKIGNHAFAFCEKVTNDLVIPDSLHIMLPYAFIRCDGIPSVKLSENLPLIPESAFSRCIGLKGEIVIHDSVTEIGIHAFYNCTNINSVKFGNKLEIIGEIAFQFCYELKGPIRLPNTLKVIGENAFQFSKITEIIYFGNQEPSCQTAFPNDDLGAITVYVGEEYTDTTFCRLSIFKKDLFETITETPSESIAITETPSESIAITETPSETIQKTSEITESLSESIKITETASETIEITSKITESQSETFIITDGPSENIEITSEKTEIPTDSIKTTENPSELDETVSEIIESDSEEVKNSSESFTASETEENFDKTYSYSETATEIPIADDIQEPPIKIISTTSQTIELTDRGYISSEENDNHYSEKIIDINSQTILMITFFCEEFTIRENRKNPSTTTIYFAASKPKSTITIYRNIAKSRIGISTAFSPTVFLSKTDTTLSFMNNISNGEIRFVINSNLISRFNLNEISNRRGNFILKVPSTIRIVSFTKVQMYRKSSFKIIYNDPIVSYLEESIENANNIHSDSDSVSIVIRESLLIYSKSQVRLMNANIFGELTLYDDSVLILEGNSNASEQSKFILIIQKIGSYLIEKPIIFFENKFNPIPSNIVLSHSKNINRIDVNDLELIGSNYFPKCEDLAQKIIFENSKKGSVSYDCIVKNESVLLVVSAKEDKNTKKLSPGAIAGIVASCIVIVAICICVLIYLVRANNHYFLSKDENEMTSTS